MIRARTELTGNLRFDRALKRYQLEDARLSGEASGDQFQGKTATFCAQGQLVLDQAAQVAEWNGLKVTVNQLRALGELKARELDKEPKFDGGLSLAPFNLREFLAGIGLTLPAMADATTLAKLEMATRVSGTRNSLNLERPQAEAGRQQLQRQPRHRRLRQAGHPRPVVGRQAEPRPLPAGQGQAGPGCHQQRTQG